jgi:nitroimidazol reductase NimA-like FMN-containing flavoprotein (pyridoxamine 5'-phosphate oxidase superfamily)
MEKKKLQSGAIEFIEEDTENRDRMKELKTTLKNKKENDLTPAQMKKLVYAIAKHLKII